MTRVVLLATLVLTVLAVGDVLRRDELGPRTTAWYLLLFTLLFVVRVAGQVFVALPPVSDEDTARSPSGTRRSATS